MSRARGPAKGPGLLDGGALPRGKLALHIGPPLAPRVEDHRRSAGQVPSPWRRLRLRRPGPHGECSTPPASPTNSSQIQPPQLGGFPGPPSSVKAPGRPEGPTYREPRGFHNGHRPSVSVCGRGDEKVTVQFGSRMVSFLSGDLVRGRLPLGCARVWAGERGIRRTF